MYRAAAATRTLLYVFVLVGTVKSTRLIIVSKRTPDRNRKRVRFGNSLDLLLHGFLEPNTAKIALFPSLLPIVYQNISEQLANYDVDIPALPQLASAPLLLLLSPAIRKHVALYVVGAALLHSGEKACFRRYLPPIWWLNVVSNMWLMWAFLMYNDCFPKSYENLLLHHPNYVPKNWSIDKTRRFLVTDSWPVLTAENAPNNGYAKGHTHLYCATLHPNEPSCAKNYLKGWVNESKTVAPWVGGFSALSILLTKRELLIRNPGLAIKDWLIATVRGTAFVVGSKNTSWGLICPFQRILPSNAIPTVRWLINSFIGSLWILALPVKRRGEISMYVARLGVLCLWKVWRQKGGISFPYGDLLLVASGWAQLSRLRKQGVRVGGLVGMGLNMVEK